MILLSQDSAQNLTNEPRHKVERRFSTVQGWAKSVSRRGTSFLLQDDSESQMYIVWVFPVHLNYTRNSNLKVRKRKLTLLVVKFICVVLMDCWFLHIESVTLIQTSSTIFALYSYLTNCNYLTT